MSAMAIIRELAGLRELAPWRRGGKATPEEERAALEQYMTRLADRLEESFQNEDHYGVRARNSPYPDWESFDQEEEPEDYYGYSLREQYGEIGWDG